MNILGLGEIAAFGTALCWTVSAIFFTRAANRIGGVTVNHARLILALPFMAGLHLATQGRILPHDVEFYRWGWLAVSGVIGLVLGDSFLFVAFALIGPRLSLLIMSLVPIISTTAAWVFLGERLLPLEATGVLVAVAGIAWVVLERDARPSPGRPSPGRPRFYVRGVLFAAAGALGQALGMVAAKKGMSGDFPAISATLIRVFAAAVTLWGVSFLRRRALQTARAGLDRKALPSLLGAVTIGAVLGIWLSLVSIQHARLGIAATIMALPPVLILPLARWQLNERVSPRAVFGTVVAFIGIAVLLVG